MTTTVTATATGTETGMVTHVTAIAIAMHVIEHGCSIAESAQVFNKKALDSRCNGSEGTSSTN